MGLRDTIETDIVAAMKSGDTDTRDALRLVRGELENIAKPGTGKAGHDPSEGEVLGAIKRTRDQLAETLSYQEMDGKDHLREQCLRCQVAILTSYLPAEATETEMAAAVARVIEENGFETMRDMGAAMGILKAELGIGADGKALSAMVKSSLSA